jgi:predicted nucleotidyltransferase
VGELRELATDLGTEERTLQRAVAQGTLRCRRPGPRRLVLLPGERDYLLGHWDLLSNVRRALRTEREVRLAVLYGSLARGDGDGDSDFDLLVSLAGEERGVARGLTARLGRVTAGRKVDVALLGRVKKTTPLLLDRVLTEGRVLVDRDGLWTDLRCQRRAIRARGIRAHRRQMASAARAIEELTR